MPKKINIEMFSEARIELTKESKEHPELVFCLNQIKEQGANEWTDQIACIAAYCYIRVDGLYTGAELDKLAEILLFKLKSMRMVTVDTPTPRIILPN